MKTILILPLLFPLYISAKTIDLLLCTEIQRPQTEFRIEFSKKIDPTRPLIGLPYFGATLQINNYFNDSVKMTTLTGPKDNNLRGDAEGVYLRLYPVMNERSEFGHYRGELFVNDLEDRAYFNMMETREGPGFICR